MLGRWVGIVFIEAFPAVEVIPAAGDGAKARIQPIGDDHQRVVMEEVRDRVFVVGVVVVKRCLQAFVVALEFDEHQGQTIDEAHQITAPPEWATLHPQLTHNKKIVLGWVLEVDHRDVHILGSIATGGLQGDAIAHQPPFGLIVLQQRFGGIGIEQLISRQGELGTPLRRGRQLGVEFAQRRIQFPHQYHLGSILAPQERAHPKGLGVEGKDRTPVEVVLKQLGGGFLNVVVFRVGGAGHGAPFCF